MIENGQTQATSMPGVYAAGDRVTSMKAVSAALSDGATAAAMVCRELCAVDLSL